MASRARAGHELGTIGKHFGDLEDHRIEPTGRHELLDILTIAICGVICGADSWVDIELFGKSKQEWLAKFLSLPSGIPSHDTFGRVFSRLDPDKFQSCFMDWVATISQITRGEVIAIDGKTVRGSHDRANGKDAIHMVSAWASANHLVLGQTKVDEKSNEITREMKRLLAAHGHSTATKGARRHQGLTHLCNVMTRPELARSELPAMMRAVGAG
jgi:hypothetical protein